MAYGSTFGNDREGIDYKHSLARQYWFDNINSPKMKGLTADWNYLSKDMKIFLGGSKVSGNEEGDPTLTTEDKRHTVYDVPKD